MNVQLLSVCNSKPFPHCFPQVVLLPIARILLRDYAIKLLKKIWQKASDCDAHISVHYPETEFAALIYYYKLDFVDNTDSKWY